MSERQTDRQADRQTDTWVGGGGRGDRERKSFVLVFLMYAPCARLRSADNYSLLLFSLSGGYGD